jgi:protein-S-isoprenylcysteine O-methyltransferase Ste14
VDHDPEGMPHVKSLIVLLRHLAAVAILPFAVTVLIPIWLTARYEAPVMGGAGLMVLRVLGIITVGLGLFLFAHSLARFATEGDGTLAPWDPPRKLVVRGPYRFVRNPMISGVILILLGEALLLHSPALGAWAVTFFAMNAIVIPFIEEPQLRDRFGDAYIEYCNNVPRLIPRVTPWVPHTP